MPHRAREPHSGPKRRGTTARPTSTVRRFAFPLSSQRLRAARERGLRRPRLSVLRARSPAARARTIARGLARHVLLPVCYRSLIALAVDRLARFHGGSAMQRTGEGTSFVARVWLESGPNGDPRWRGHVQHVQSGRDGFFDDLCALRNFVERVSGIAGPALQPQARRAGRPSAGPRGSRKAAPARPRKKHGA